MKRLSREEKLQLRKTREDIKNVLNNIKEDVKNRLSILSLETAGEMRNILINDWNPIGGKVPQDEYDSYIFEIFQLILYQANCYLIAQHLEHIKTNLMGFEPKNTAVKMQSFAKDMKVAQKLSQIRIIINDEHSNL